MINFKKNISILLIWLLLSFIIILISAIFVYAKIINLSDKPIYIFLLGILIFIILGFLSGNIKQNKGLLNGVVQAFILVVLLFFIHLLGSDNKFSFDLTVKYLIYILSAGFGGIIGVNFKPLVKYNDA